MMHRWNIVGYAKELELHENKCEITLDVIARKEDGVVLDEDEPFFKVVYYFDEIQNKDIKIGDMIYVEIKDGTYDEIKYIEILPSQPDAFAPILKKLRWYN